MRRLHTVTRAIASHGLPGATAEWPPAPLEPTEWAAVVDEATGHGLTGLLAAAIADGALAVNARQREQIEQHQLAVAMRAVAIDDATAEMVELLRTVGVEVRLLKGVALAHLDYPEPIWRTYGDADVLVRGRDLAVVAETLTGARCVRDLPERRAGFDRRFAKDITFHGPGGVQFDVHRTLVWGWFGMRLPLDTMWQRHERFDLGGVSVSALAIGDRFVHACYAAMLAEAEPRASLLRDVAQLLGHERFDRDQALETATAADGLGVVASAVSEARTLLGALPESSILHDLEGHDDRPRDRLLRRTYPAFGGSHPVATLAATFGVRGNRERMRYLLAVLFPDASYRAARRRVGRRSEWRLLLGKRARRRR